MHTKTANPNRTVRPAPIVFTITTSDGHTDPDCPECTYAYRIRVAYEDADGVRHAEDLGDDWYPDDHFWESAEEARRAAQERFPVLADDFFDYVTARGVALATREYVVR
jgi:hypothetical protein